MKYLKLLLIGFIFCFRTFAISSDLKIVKIYKIFASSTLKPAKKYGVSKLFDGKINSAWVEGKDDDGIGESVDIVFDTEIALYNLVIYNGLQIGKYFKMNNRVKDLEIHLNGNEAKGQIIRLKDKMGPQIIFFYGGPNKKFRIRLTIRSVYKGTKWKDTAISEIQIPDNACLDTCGFKVCRPVYNKCIDTGEHQEACMELVYECSRKSKNLKKCMQKCETKVILQ